MRVSDRELEAAIRKALRDRMELSELDINVDVRDGEVVLTGVVDVLSEKVYAATLVSRLPGVKNVENNLTVSTDGTITDADIKKEIMSVFREDKSPEMDRVDVKVNRGTVELAGRAGSLAASNEAVETARKTRGVKDVVSRLKPGGEPVDDATVTTGVKSALAGAGFSTRTLDVVTRRGRVTLKGWVDTPEDIEAAAEVAAGVTGVVKLNNRLKARSRDRSNL